MEQSEIYFEFKHEQLITDTTMIRGMMMSYMNSCQRNNYMFTMLDRAKGKIDTQYLKMMYRNGGRLPVGPWDKIVKDYKKTGDWGEISTAHASNALTAVMKPSEGLFYLCTGPAKRGLTPLLPGAKVPIYNETNAFWEIKLSSSPADVAAYAKQRAQEYIDEAISEFTKLETSDAAYEPLKRLLNIARSEAEEGRAHEESAKKADGNESLYNWAKATRSYTRAQVRAKQAYNALVPPPDKPEDLRFS